MTALEQTTLRQEVPAPVEALLSDGSVVVVRAVRRSDAAALRELHLDASDRTRQMRFMGVGPGLAERYAEHLARPDDHHLAMVVERDDRLLGVATAEPPAPGASAATSTESEVALLVADRWQHHGVGTLLLEHLAAAARRAGIVQFTAEVLAENAAMLGTFAHAGFTVTAAPPSVGTVSLTIDLTGSAALTAAVAERERRADAASIAPVFAPAGVVVVGAGREPGGIGRSVLDNILDGGFHGAVTVINRHTEPGASIGGVPAVRSAAEVSHPIDLAVIAVPATAVAPVLRDCGAAGARAAVVLTSGFAGGGWADSQGELVAIAHRFGMRLVGPNCLGVLNTDPAVGLNATFAALPAVPPGRLGLASQSGALGIAVLDAAARRGLGTSSFVSLGNKADVSGNDLLLYWEGDPRTKAIALYLESIGNPRRFRRIAARVAAHKPVIALRSGRSAAGARAGASHTAAAATPDAVAAALFRDSGVIAVETTEELLDVGALLTAQPVPAGLRVAVIGNAGGPGALTADSAVAAGADVPEFSTATVAALRAGVPSAASVGNPIDLGADASPQAYQAALATVLGSGEVDAVIALHAITRAQPVSAVIRAVQEAATDPRITVAGVLLGAEPPTTGTVPWYAFGESAARAVARAGGLGVWRSAPRHPQAAPHADAAAVAALLAHAERSTDGWLASVSAYRLLDLVGIPACPTAIVTGAAAAAAAAAAMPDRAVVLKSGAPGLVHKSDSGAVAVGLRGPAQVREAAIRIHRITGSDTFLIQPQASGRLEMTAGLVAPRGGIPVVMVGAGGVNEAVLADKSLRTCPLNSHGAEAMLAELRSDALLRGHRGSPPLDRAAVVDVLVRLAWLVGVAPEIAELDLNPLLVDEHGLTAVDVAVRLRPVAEAGVPDRRDATAEDFARSLS